MDKQLRTLVDLEALLNDGTAYVLFFLLRVWAEGRHQTASDAVKCGRRALSIHIRACMLCSRSLADLASVNWQRRQVLVSVLLKYVHGSGRGRLLPALAGALPMGLALE